MTFLYPLAFLVLLAIPVLIVIYILRNKYKEGRVASTYLWEISQKFLKKRNPLNKFEHLLALIIQSLTIFALAVCLAHPQLTLKGQADNITFVLDTSASMQIVDNGTTRFEKAKTAIKKAANDSKDGSKFTLVTAGSESKLICLSVEDKSRFEMFVDTVSVTDLASDLEESMNSAQKYLSDGTSNKVYLATDKKFGNDMLENVELIDVSNDVVNYSINNVSYSYDSKGVLNVIGDVYGYGYIVPEDVISSTDATVRDKYAAKVRFYVNDTSKGWTNVFTVNDQKNTFSVSLGSDVKEADLKEITCKIENEDALAKDNSFTIYNNSKVGKTNVLIVGTVNNFIKGFFEANSSTSYKIISGNAYTGNEGYDITVFSKYTPKVLPTTGAVWFIGCTDSVEGAGFIAQNTYDLDQAGHLKYSNDSSLLYKQLTDKTANNDIIISQYTRFTIDDDLTPILTYNNLPVVFAGKNSKGQREVNIGFDIETSNISMKYDFLRLLFNFTKYSNPKVMTKFDYSVGSKTTFSLPDNLDRITIVTPTGKEETIEKGNDDYSEYTFEEAGTYDIKVTYTSTSQASEEMKVYSSFSIEEGDPLVVETKSYKLALKDDAKKGDAIYDTLLWVVIACAVLFATDWILYAHEQY